jgi:hypothetical protein
MNLPEEWDTCDAGTALKSLGFIGKGSGLSSFLGERLVGHVYPASAVARLAVSGLQRSDS